MASVSWRNNNRSSNFIDLTHDDEEDDEDDPVDAKALLERFTKSGAGSSRPLKRKSRSHSPDVKTVTQTPIEQKAEHGVQTDNGQWPAVTTNGETKQETKQKSAHVFASFFQPGSQTRLDSALPSKRHISDSPYVSSASPAPNRLRRSVSRGLASKRQPRSSSVLTDGERQSNIMVVVPLPPPASSRGSSKRKINRLPSASPEDTEESDPDEPKGIKPKYYPLDMYKIQAEKGRYPQVRSTHAELQVLPTRPATVLPYHCRIRAPHSKKIYLRDLLEKKLRTIQGPPVTMAGEWDGNGSLASNFEFTNSYKLQQGVTRVPEEFNGGCPCGIQCDPSQCQCLSQEEDSEERMVPYEYRNGKLLLRDSFIHKNAMIYECSSHCGCLKTCWNRLVQHGRSIRLEIFHTGSRGFGLRSPDFIHRGQFIDTYLGEVITSAEAEIRENASDGSQTSPSYLFSLDWFPPSNDNDEDDYYVVDGQRFGGPSRFMNHSCNPNCKMFPISTHHGDQRIYDLAFFARRDIPPGTELTFDYNPHWNGDMNSDPNAVKCLCGEAKCRGQLWPNQRKSTKLELD